METLTPLSWTTKSVRNLAEELRKEGFSVSHVKVKEFLEQEGYSLQANRKLKQAGKAHEDRDAQFSPINKTTADYISNGQPVISVDCKKKENLGEFANKGLNTARRESPSKSLTMIFTMGAKGKLCHTGHTTWQAMKAM